MKYIVFTFITILVVVPTSVFAVCTDAGATVVYVNGVMNSQTDAEQSRYSLENEFKQRVKNSNVKFITGYNPSHLAGLGDLVQSVAQMLDTSVSDHDLNTILMQIQPEVTTRKILLVGHSQGTFYTNSLYTYLIGHGVPKESIAVYNVATPASEVAGGGSYLTSSNDSVIQKATTLAQKLQILLPLPANINIPTYSDDAQSGYPSHDFIHAYIAGAADQIVSDVSRALNALTAEASAETCFTAPQPTMSYKAGGVALAVIDPVANISTSLVTSIAGGAYQAGSMLASAVINTASALGSVVNSIIKLPAGVSDSLITSNLAGSPAGQAGPAAATINIATESTAAPVIKNEPTNLTTASVSSFAVLSVSTQSSNSEPDKTMISTISQIQNKSDPYHDFGGGRDNTSVANLEIGLPSDVTAPVAPIIIAPADFIAIFTASVMAFQGTAEASSTISTDFNLATTTANVAGNWQISLNFPQGTSTIRFFATDAAGNQSSSTEISLFVDSVVPLAPEFFIAECATSLSSAGCLVATITLHLQWSSDASDINYYELSYGDTVSTTTETFKILNLNDNTDYNFSLRSRDHAGNWSDAIFKIVIINTAPVVINEVAWAGTAASANDEWIELYNRTSLAIELDKWALQAQDGVPYINLSGSISPKSYYLIERTDDNTIKDIAADLTAPFSGLGSGSGLGNTGETLLLSYKLNGAATTTIDQTAVNIGAWLGGDDYYKRTMERYDPDISGVLSSNWGTNNLIKNGLDKNGNAVSGTPKARNSANYLIAQGNNTISSSITLKKSRSPYVVNNQSQTVSSGAILTIEPGVVIKFFNDAGLNIQGKIIAQGTAVEPIVFTSFSDDAYGGDANGDATSSSPSAGSWYGVGVKSGSSGAIFDHAIFRYGGKYYNGGGYHQADLYIENIDGASVKNSVFEFSRIYGLHLRTSSSVIEGNEFRFNNYSGEYTAAGLFAENDHSFISANSFSQNRMGLSLSGSETDVENNNFSGNSNYAAYSSGFLGKFLGNTGADNSTNGIVIADTLTRVGSTTKLFVNSLPYVVRSSYPTIAASSTLTIDSGVIIKLQNRIMVYGNLVINGENPEDIILTSLYDDSVGGDTTNDATSTLPAPGQWTGIDVRSGGSVNARGFTVRYAGSESYGGDSGGFMLNNATANISNALFDSNYPHGIYAGGGNQVSIENTSFKNHTRIGAWGAKAAFEFSNSAISLSNVSFINNFLGVLGNSLSSISASGIQFLNNVTTTSPANLF